MECGVESIITSWVFLGVRVKINQNLVPSTRFEPVVFRLGGELNSGDSIPDGPCLALEIVDPCTR